MGREGLAYSRCSPIAGSQLHTQQAPGKYLFESVPHLGLRKQPPDPQPSGSRPTRDRVRVGACSSQAGPCPLPLHNQGYHPLTLGHGACHGCGAGNHGRPLRAQGREVVGRRGGHSRSLLFSSNPSHLLCDLGQAPFPLSASVSPFVKEGAGPTEGPF